MNRTRLIHRLGPIVILASMAGMTLGQEVAPETTVTETNRAEFFAKFAVADYDAPLPENPDELAQRRIKGQRYDNSSWVAKNPNPDADYARRSLAIQPISAFPIEDSDVVVIGLAIGVSAYLSNDKTGVYSEYTIRVEQVLKDGGSRNLMAGSTITMDRAGGAVRYPDGHKVAYFIAERKLPVVGTMYALFLRDDKRSKSFDIVTLYELKRDSVVPVDSGYSFEEVRGMTKSAFIKTVQEKVVKRSDD
ncbi:MAG TPA: hypothetical protein VJV05_06475 [Pyrinomonadaceae bacterium]|nr:hypothetical protein [Pyrinomonadaceae bacterium]